MSLYVSIVIKRFFERHDNKVPISIAHNLVQHDRTKYIEVDRHFIKEKLLVFYLYSFCPNKESTS